MAAASPAGPAPMTRMSACFSLITDASLQERFNSSGQQIAVSTAFSDLIYRNTGFLRDDCRDPGKTETALTSAHSCTCTPFDTVDGSCADRTVYSLPDLCFCNYLTAANDTPLGRVLTDSSLLPGRGKISERYARTDIGNYFRFFAGADIFRSHGCKVFSDSRR